MQPNQQRFEPHFYSTVCPEPDFDRIFRIDFFDTRIWTAFLQRLEPLEPRQHHFGRIFTMHSREARGLTAFLHAQTPFGHAASHVDRIFTRQNKGTHFQPHFYTQKSRKREKPAFLHGLQEPF